MTTGALIARKQNRYIRRFQAAGATTSASARTPEELGCRRSFSFDHLVSRGVFVEVSEGRYYIDVARAIALRSRRRVVILVALGIAVVVLLVLIWAR